LRIPRHLDSDSTGNWTAIPRATGQLSRSDRDVIGTLTLDEWREVLRLNARGQILSMLAKHGRDALPRIKAMLPAMKSNEPDEPYFSEEKRFRSY
jgi:hypothetical protein